MMRQPEYLGCKLIIAKVDELTLHPCSIVLVIHLRFGCLFRRQVAQDVLSPDHLHVDPPLCLSPQHLDRSGHDDHQPVAGINRLGDDSGEVRRLSALYVSDHEALRLVGGHTGRIREPFDDIGCGQVERGHARLGPLPHVEQVVTITGPIECVIVGDGGRIPPLPWSRDDEGLIPEQPTFCQQDFGALCIDPEKFTDAVPSLRRRGRRTLGPLLHREDRIPLVDLHAESAEEWIRRVRRPQHVRQVRRAQRRIPVGCFRLCSGDDVLRRSVLDHLQRCAKRVTFPVVVHGRHPVVKPRPRRTVVMTAPGR